MNYLYYLLIGIAAAAIDTIPMIVRKLDVMFILSAAFTWIILGLLVPNTRFVEAEWLNGVIVSLMVTIPMLFLIARLDRAALLQVIGTTLLLGAGIGFAGSLVSG